ncbi:MAG: hypothetical protein IBX64_04180 [Actinobacteria bacterium]|nr:hypothetical protein [Actinomycetota bacterium]
MDLGRILSVLWKRRSLIFIGIIAGIAFSFLSLYSVNLGLDATKPFLSHEPRSQDIFKTTIRLVLDEPGFGLGRVVHPRSVERERTHELSELAAVYSYLLMSDQLTEKIAPELEKINGKVEASPVEKLPIIEVSVSGNDPEGVRDVAAKTAANFMDYVMSEQVKNQIPPSDRTVIRAIGEPSIPTQEKSRKAEIAFVFFILPIAGASFLAFGLENIRQGKLSEDSGSGMSSGVA